MKAVKQIHSAHDVDLRKYVNTNATADKDISELSITDADAFLNVIKNLIKNQLKSIRTIPSLVN